MTQRAPWIGSVCWPFKHFPCLFMVRHVEVQGPRRQVEQQVEPEEEGFLVKNPISCSFKSRHLNPLPALNSPHSSCRLLFSCSTAHGGCCIYVWVHGGQVWKARLCQLNLRRRSPAYVFLWLTGGRPRGSESGYISPDQAVYTRWLLLKLKPEWEVMWSCAQLVCI